MAIRFSEQRRLTSVVHTEDTEQLPCMMALGHVADTEQHAFPRVFLVEGLAHPVQRSLVGSLPPTAIGEHGVGFPIAIRAVVGARGIFELETKIIGTGLERLQLLIEERPLARGLRIQSPFLFDLIRLLGLIEESGVSRPDHVWFELFNGAVTLIQYEDDSANIMYCNRYNFIPCDLIS